MVSTQKVTLYVHAHFNTAGQFTGYNINCGWKYEEKVSEYGLYVFLFEKEVEIEIPEDEAVLKGKGVEVVEKTMQDLTAKHQARLTALLGLKNRLLCLAAPDILDAGTSASLDAMRDDDIPF